MAMSWKHEQSIKVDARFEVLPVVRKTMFFLVVTSCGLAGAVQHCHFSPEDGDRMFLRNVGIYLRVYTASQPRTT
jgi:hypothetical protein